MFCHNLQPPILKEAKSCNKHNGAIFTATNLQEDFQQNIATNKMGHTAKASEVLNHRPLSSGGWTSRRLPTALPSQKPPSFLLHFDGITSSFLSSLCFPSRCWTSSSSSHSASSDKSALSSSSCGTFFPPLVSRLAGRRRRPIDDQDSEPDRPSLLSALARLELVSGVRGKDRATQERREGNSDGRRGLPERK